MTTKNSWDDVPRAKHQNQTIPLLGGQTWPSQPNPGWPPLSDNSVETDEARGPERHADCTWNSGVGSVRATRVGLRLDKEKLF